ncbi:MAG TPA: aminoglycoside adenylyltransferase domain-containing protein [Gaiellaceae bacterium]|nr:aminoglycoside adenylyltransferase domain-containing protein [Gaiellaceae bacterium]
METTGPTPYDDLNAVLSDFLASVREILGDDFVGAYLQGSFALGDADEHSDVDFIVVIDDELTDDQIAGLQSMHERLYALEVPWAQHLEGSYVPRENLRRVDPSRSPYVYLDNGATELVLDNHCNTAVVRWTLREHGVVLLGPDPRTLIEPVSADELADDVRVAGDEWAKWLADNVPSRRGQGVLVLSLCRMLQTLAEGHVTTKPEAGRWALRTLEPEWRPLIRFALDDRPDPWRKVREPADPTALEQTRALLDYVRSEARHAPGTRRE